MSIKYGILAILSRRPFYGYELKQELETELGVNWSINFGQIYTTLDRLERDMLVVLSDTVTVSDAPDRKLYTITPAGISELNKWFLCPITKIDNFRNELYAKVILSLTSNIPTDDVLQVQRKAELQKLHELTNLKEKADQAIEIPWVLQLDLAILQTEAKLRWLSMCEARLSKLKNIYERDLAVKVKMPGKDSNSVGGKAIDEAKQLKTESIDIAERGKK